MELSEAKKIVEENLEKGIGCLCCGQFAKKYKRKLNSGMGITLIHIYKLFINKTTTKEYVHIKEYLRENSLHNSHDALLKFWGLIKPKIAKRDDESKSNGYYKITQKGIDFVEGEIKVKEHIFLYNSKCLGFSDDEIDIHGAVRNKFRYNELMGFNNSNLNDWN